MGEAKRRGATPPPTEFCECGRAAAGSPCPICGRRLCYQDQCADDHGVAHFVTAGMTEQEARLAMLGDIDSVPERLALAMANGRAAVLRCVMGCGRPSTADCPCGLSLCAAADCMAEHLRVSNLPGSINKHERGN